MYKLLGDGDDTRANNNNNNNNTNNGGESRLDFASWSHFHDRVYSVWSMTLLGDFDWDALVIYFF